jgi:hypothetical protein
MASLPASRTVFAPLALGSHVDHQLTRLAAELWLGAESLNYYEDFPYSEMEDELALVDRNGNRWRSSVVELQPVDVKARIDAISCYRSQLSTFFAGRQDLILQITDNIRRAGGERFWRLVD